MTLHLGKVKPGATLYIPFDTFAGSTGASITMSGLAVTDIEIYRNGSTTQRASDTGYTLLDTDGIDFDALTGIHGFSVDLSSNADSGFFVAGGFYWVVVSAITVDSQTVSFVAATFSIGYEGAILDTTIATLASQTSFTLTAGPAEDDALNGCEVVIHDIASAVQAGRAIVSDYTGSTRTVTLVAGVTFTAAAGDNISIFRSALQPTIQGRALDVSTGGEAGVDWANVGSPTTAVNLSATNIDVDQVVASVSGAVGSVTGAVGSVTGNVGGNVTGSVGSVATGGITAASIATGAIDADALAADASTEINAGVLAVLGALADAAADGDPTTGDTVMAYIKQLVNVLTGTAGIVTFPASATPGNAVSLAEVIRQIYDEVAGLNGGALLDAAGVRSAVGLASANLDTQLDALPTAAENADAVWDEAIAGHLGAGSTGAALNGATAPTAAAVADAVWDETLADHLTAGSTGAGLNAAGSAGDPWSTALPGAYGAGSAGNILGNRLVGTIATGTHNPQSGDAYARLGAPAGASVSADILTIDNLVDDLESRLGTPSNLGGGATIAANLADIEAQTDDIGTAGAGLTALASAANLAAVAGYLDTEIAAILEDTGTTIPAQISALNNLSAAQVNAEVDTALADVNLDHLVGTATGIPAIPAGTYLDQIMDDGTAAFDRTTDSLQAIRDRGDAAWDTADVSALALQSSVDTLEASAAAIEADTQDIQGRLPAALVGGRMDANAGAISGDATAADNLEAALDGTGGVTITAGLTGNITGNLSGSVGSLTANNDKTGYALSAAGVDAILDEPITEPAGVFAWASGSLRAIIGWVGALARNRMTQTATTQTLRNDANSADLATSTHSDDTTTHVRGEWT